MICKLSDFTDSKPRLRLFQPTEEASHIARYRINGYPATLHLWTEGQWASLKERPADAQCVGSGIWCALRIET